MAFLLNRAPNCLLVTKNIKPLYFYAFRKASHICEETVGCREIVGNGHNSECAYIDHPAFPFPAVRFQEDSPEILALREKEKGDWRKLSLDEKKKLYRHSFCQTYAEMYAPNGLWKSIIGKGLLWMSVGLWLFIFMKWLWCTELPETYAHDRRKAQLERMLKLEINPIIGLSSKYDYANNKWK